MAKTFITSLNAPFGARCFLTDNISVNVLKFSHGLNAPFGARCFLTGGIASLVKKAVANVLMHLLALGAF